MQREWDILLEAKGPGGAWTHATMPFRAEEVFGSRGRIPVAGTINGFAFRSSIMPRGDGTHYLTVNKAMLQGAQASPGEVVRFSLARDTEQRRVELPEELAAALRADPRAGELFAALALSHQKEYAAWVGEAKKAETRAARAQKALEKLAAGKLAR